MTTMPYRWRMLLHLSATRVMPLYSSVLFAFTFQCIPYIPFDASFPWPVLTNSPPVRYFQISFQPSVFHVRQAQSHFRSPFNLSPHVT